METFTDQCSGKVFAARNAKLEVKQTSKGKLFFVGSTDERGYISDAAAALLREEMSKPRASLKKALCLLTFSVIHTVNDDGEDVEIPTLHLAEAPTLWSY